MLTNQKFSVVRYNNNKSLRSFGFFYIELIVLQNYLQLIAGSKLHSIPNWLGKGKSNRVTPLNKSTLKFCRHSFPILSANVIHEFIKFYPIFQERREFQNSKLLKGPFLPIHPSTINWNIHSPKGYGPFPYRSSDHSNHL
jgi:hypothetical protein